VADLSISEISLTREEVAAATRVLESGMLRQGKECSAFEQEFAEYTGAAHAITCANGTAALQLAYLACVKPGDEVLVPSMTFIATANMVIAAGATPILCDVDPETYLIDLADAQKRVTDKTTAIAPVHLHGNICDLDAVADFATSNDLKVVWDGAQCHGGTHDGQGVGRAADFVTYSFYPSKNMFVGEGGMVTTNDPEYDHFIRFTRAHGQTAKNHFTMFGYNLRMTDVEATIGRLQLARLDEMLEIRRANAAVLTEGLAGIEGITPQRVTENTGHAMHQYSVIVDAETFGCDRSELATALKERGIGSGVHYPSAIHEQPIWHEMYGRQDDLPVSEHLGANFLSLPVHHGMGVDDAARVVDAVAEIAAG